ncbi:hypothetical protein AB1Y20_014969 [Prymnesium parvum]|uniref:Uncharacterized protein n=1 Tax=Prymnesium parvum TaxID=97485 RepID=A0AB34JX10_PRYPA
MAQEVHDVGAQLIAQMKGEDTTVKLRAIAVLTQRVNLAYGVDAVLLAQDLRINKGIEALVDLLDDPIPEIQQCSMSVLGNLLTNIFEPTARQSLKIFDSNGGIEKLVVQLGMEFPHNLYAAACMQNVTALDPTSTCVKLEQLGAPELLNKLSTSEQIDPQAQQYAIGALANIRAFDPNIKLPYDMEERLKERRLQDIVEAMRARRAIKIIQAFGRFCVGKIHARGTGPPEDSLGTSSSKNLPGRDEEAAPSPIEALAHDEGASQAAGKEDIQIAAEGAATKLQSHQRGHRARTQLEVETRMRERAAVDIQARVRGYQAQAKVQRMREEETIAAAKLQAVAKGKLVREELNTARHAGEVNLCESDSATTLSEAKEATTDATEKAETHVEGGPQTAAPSAEANLTDTAEATTVAATNVADIVLVTGLADDETTDFCTNLAARLGGSVLHMEHMLHAASHELGALGDELRNLLDQRKLVPVQTQVQVLSRAMRTKPPPFLLCDFPRMAMQLAQMEQSVGEVRLALHLCVEGAAEDRMVNALLKPLRSTGRVASVVLGESALSEAEAAVRAARPPSLATAPEVEYEASHSRTPAEDECVHDEDPPIEDDTNTNDDTREMNPPVALTATNSASDPLEVNMSLVLVVGGTDEEKEEFCTMLAEKVGGSVLNMELLIQEASLSSTPRSSNLRSMVENHKLIPAETQIQLLARAMESRPAPFLLCHFPRMVAHLNQVKAALGGVGLALHLIREGEPSDRMVDALLKPLQNSGLVANVEIGASAVADGASAMRKAGIVFEAIASTDSVRSALAASKESGSVEASHGSICEAPTAATAIEAETETARAHTVEEEKALVLVVGAVEEKEADKLCSSLVAKLGGTVISMNRLVASAIETGLGGELLDLLQQGKLIPAELQMRLLADVKGKATPYFFCGFPRLLAHIHQLESRLDCTGLVLHLHRAEEVEDPVLEVLLRPLREVKHVVNVAIGPSAVLEGETALRAAGAIPAAAVNMNLVLVTSSTADKDAYCASLAARVGGSVINVTSLVALAQENRDPDGKSLLSLLHEGQLIPTELHARLIARAMAHMPTPHLLCDFPCMPSQLQQLEALVGRVCVAVHLCEEWDPEERSVEALLQPLRESGRVENVTVGTSALSDGEAVLRDAGVTFARPHIAASELLQQEVSADAQDRSVNSEASHKSVCEAPTVATARTPEHRALVLVVGAVEEKEAEKLCSSLVAKLGGTVVSMNRLVASAIETGLGGELLDLLQQGKLIPAELQMRLLADVKGKATPYFFCGFPRLLAHIHQLESRLDCTGLVLHLHRAEEVEDPVLEVLLRPLREVKHVVNIAIGPSAVLEGETALRAAGAIPAAAVNMNLVLVTGSTADKDAYCASLAARVGGSVINMNSLVAVARQSQDPDDESLLSLLQQGQLIPTELHARLIARAMAYMPTPHLLCDFPCMPSQLQQLEALVGRVCVAVHMHEEGQPEERSVEALLQPLRLSGCVEVIRPGWSAVPDGEAALVKAGVPFPPLPAPPTLNTNLVLVAGSASEKNDFCKLLAAKVGGSVLHVETLMSLTLSSDSAEAAQLRQLVEQKKLIPAELHMQLIERALKVLPAPYLLCDFPRMPAHLKQLEVMIGAVCLALHFRVPGEEEHMVEKNLLQPLRERGRVVTVCAGASALSQTTAAMREAGILDVHASLSGRDETSETSDDQLLKKNTNVVLVVGAASEKEEFSASLCAKTGASLLDMTELVASACKLPDADGEEVALLLKQRKLLPADLQVRLVVRAMESMPPPYLLVDFPRMRAHLEHLEAAVGAVGLVLHVYHEDEPLNRPVEVLLKPLREAGCVVRVQLGPCAVSDGQTALREIGLIRSEGSPDEDVATTSQQASGTEVDIPVVAPASAPADAAEQGLARSRSSRVNMNVVLVTGAAEEGDAFCSSLASRVGGSVIVAERLMNEKSMAGSAEVAELEELMERGKLIPADLRVRLIARAMESMPAPYFLFDFSRMPAHLSKLQSLVGDVGLALFLHREGEAADQKVPPMLRPLEEEGRVVRIMLGASALSEGEAALDGAGVPTARAASSEESAQSAGAPAESSVDEQADTQPDAPIVAPASAPADAAEQGLARSRSSRVNMNVVLVTGAAEEGDAFCSSLASRVGGSVIVAERLMNETSMAGSAEVAELEELMERGKLIPADLRVRLIARAMESMPAPYFLFDFSRMPAHLSKLQSLVGDVGLALFLHREGEAADQKVPPMLRPLEEEGRVVRIMLGASALSEGEAALDGAGVPTARAASSEESAQSAGAPAESSVDAPADTQPDAPIVAPASAPADAAEQGLARSRSSRVNMNVVLVTGAAEEGDAFCSSLASRVGGSVIVAERLMNEKSMAGSAEVAELEELMERGKLIPADLRVRLIARAMESMPAPYFLFDFSRMPAHLSKLQSLVGDVGLALFLHREGEAADQKVPPMLRPLEEEGRVVRIMLGASALSEGEAALDGAGVPTARAASSEESAQSAGAPAESSVDAPADTQPDAPIVAPASAPADAAEQGLARSRSSRVNMNVVLVTGAAEEGDAFCSSLASRVGGSVIVAERLMNEKSMAGSAEVAELEELMERGKLIPADLRVRLIARAMESMPAPYFLFDFSRMPAHLNKLQSLVGDVGLALFLHREGEAADQKVPPMLRPLEEEGRVVRIMLGASALSEGEAALDGAGVPTARAASSEESAPPADTTTDQPIVAAPEVVQVPKTDLETPTPSARSPSKLARRCASVT